MMIRCPNSGAKMNKPNPKPERVMPKAIPLFLSNHFTMVDVRGTYIALDPIPPIKL
jgi:hypothetical protein